MKLLAPAEKIYHFAVALKNFFYDRGMLRPFQVDVPVLSVGNLSFGGTGKTPCIVFLAAELSDLGRICVVAKSYRASLTEPKRVDLSLQNAPDVFGDEACLIQTKLKSVTVWSGPEKYRTAEASLADHPMLLLVDDGFSHRQLKRDFDLILVDATAGLSGYLREPVQNLKRAQAVLVTKSNLVESEALKSLIAAIHLAAPHLQEAVFSAESRTQLDFDTSLPVSVFCGLARPEPFIAELKQRGYRVVRETPFADHFEYPADVQSVLYKQFLEDGQKYPGLRLLTTEKDAVKITDANLLKVLTLARHQMEMTADQKEVFLEKIRQYI